MMKLYDTKRAPNPRRVRWFMAEKDITDIEIVEISIMGGEHKQPDYIARAGLANVPALEIDAETTITESIAICRYLESVYPDPNLFGRDAKETAVIEMWTRRAEMLVSTPLMLSVRHSLPALAAIETQVPEVAATNRQAGERALKMIDRQLADREFIAADRVTMADIVAITAIDFAKLVQFAPDPALENVERWRVAMKARAAASAGV